MSATAIKSALVAAMEEMTGSGQPLKAVYRFNKTGAAAYPYACVLFAGTGGKVRLDSASDFLISRFTIRVVIDAENSEEEEEQIISLTDAVLNKFMTSANIDTLGGACDRFDIAASPLFVENAEMTVRGVEFSIEAAKRILIS